MSLFTTSATLSRNTVVRFVVYVVILTAAYYYNVTFVQLGLNEIGMEKLGLSMGSVATAMGLLAIATLTVTLVSGYLLDRFGLGTDPLRKFRVLFGVLLLQLGVTFALSTVSSFWQLLVGILACAVLLGTAIPFAFSLMLDLVPPGWSGYAAGTVAGGAFSLAALFPFEWAPGNFAPAAVVALAPAVFLLGVLSVFPGLLGAEFGQQDRETRYPLGDRSGTVPITAAPVVVGLTLLFGAFFVDSLGFVRIIETPAYVNESWQSGDDSTRLVIAVTHVVGGLAAGVVYTKLRQLWLFAVTFGLFATAQFLYAYDIAVGGPSALTILIPVVYVLAVSCYTTITFALWPDLATPETVGRYTAVGVGLGGWLATFTSTALALVSERRELDLELHLFAVGILSALFLFLTVSLRYLVAGHDGETTAM